MDPRPGGVRPGATRGHPTQMNRFDTDNSPTAALPCCALLTFALVFCCLACIGAEPALPTVVTGRTEETNAPDTLRALLQIQEQLHATQLALERNRQETEAAAARNAETLAGRLQGIEQALAAQRAQELEAMQSSNRGMLIVAGSFAALGFVAMLLMAYFQWRTISRLAEICSALPVPYALGGVPAIAALGAGEAHRVSVGPPEQSNQRLLGALERLEKRIYELEHTARPPLSASTALPQELTALPHPPPNGDPVGASVNAPVAPEAARITLLLGKGQSLLNLDHAEEALACFDEILTLDVNHPEALVKKGAALERLRKSDEAIACYDRAIAADNNMTVAYLYKGGLFNRLERFGEALECYEQALRTQENRRG
jgi:tetratricopeptide (TPR) repeat protein